MSEVSNDTYVSVQRFHTKVMQTMDEGSFKEFAEFFTADGEFAHTPGKEPARTREGILADLLEHHANLPNPDARRRHWFGHMRLSRIDEHAIDSFTYAVVVNTKPNEKPYISFSGAVHDILVEDGGRFLIQRRELIDDRLR